MIKYNVNVCDHAGSELMVHFTKACPNNCSFCIDKMNLGVATKKTNVDAIIYTIEQCKDKVTQITISGGEPFVFMDELNTLIDYLKSMTSLRVTVVTSLPKICYEQKDKFFSIVDECDEIQISLHHYVDQWADKIKGIEVDYNFMQVRKEFLKEIVERYGDKVLGMINILKPYFENKWDILQVIRKFNALGFKRLKICEMFDADDLYVDIAKTLEIKLPSPFAHGCKTEYDITGMIPEFNGKLYIKRTCFFRTKKQKASILDLIKISTRWMFAKKYFFGVIHEDGTLAPYWI